VSRLLEDETLKVELAAVGDAADGSGAGVMEAA
jgi:hypothetical protein